MSIRTLPFCVIVLVNLIASQVPAAAQTGAGAFVKELGDQAIRVLTVKDISDAEREERFRTLFRKGFDVKRIGRFVLGRYARGADPALMEEYQGLFEDLIVATYAARFAEYSGQDFVIRRVTQSKNGGDAIVMSEVRPNDGGPPIRVDWQVRGGEGDYRIVDVRVEGVSMSVTQRDEFTTVIRKNNGKLEALLEILRKKTESLKSDTTGK